MPEHLHEPDRLALEEAGIAVALVQAAVDEDQAVGQGLLALAALGRATAGERLLAARDQPARDPVDGPGVEIVVAHEPLDAEALALVDVAEVLGDPRLQVASEDVVLVAGQEVERVARAPQERERLVGQGLLAGGDEPPVGELTQRARLELGGTQPHGRVHVAQAARGLLHVRLADVGRGAVLAIPLVALGQSRGEELLEVAPVHVLAEHAAEVPEEPAVAGHEPRLLHRRTARQVRARHGDAVVEGTQAVADLQPEVPQRVQQLLGHPLDVRGQFAVVDDHEVDVRRGVQLAAPVAAEGDQDERLGGEALVREVGRDQPDQRADQLVDELGVRADGLLTRRAVGVSGLEGFQALGKRGAEEIDPQAAPVRPALGLGFRASGPAIQLGRHDGAERSNAGRRLSNAAQTYYNRRVRSPWRAILDSIVPYEAGKSLEALERELGLEALVRLSANESPLGPSSRVVEAIRREAPRVHLYPDGGSLTLRRALAGRLGVGPGQIVAANGADELLALIATAAFEAGDEVVVTRPAF